MSDATVMRISLVMPPFASVTLPSLGLTQLKARLHGECGVSASVHYLNHDMATAVGVELYEAASYSTAIYHTGFGDWFFRQVAFPELEDNRERYLGRYFRRRTPEREVIEKLLAGRERLPELLDELIARHELDRATIVGFTSMFAQTVCAIALARRIKAQNPDAICVLGGPACEAPMGKELARWAQSIDWVFSGPALVSFPRFVSEFSSEPQELAKIPGVFSRASSAPGRLPLVDEASHDLGEELALDEPIELDYREFLESYARHVSDRSPPVLLFETSRGCWWGEIRHCKFCGLNGATMAHREMGAERALAQFRELFARYPAVTRFAAVDNILPISYLKSVLPRLEPPPGTTLFYEVKANMSEADVATLARAGVKAIQPGIESLDSRVLALMQKGVSAFQNLRLLKYCLLYDVHPEWYIMLGFPGEPDAVHEKYLRDLPHLSHLPPPYSVTMLRFDRYSPYFERASEHGLTLRPLDFYGLTFPCDEASLERLAYHFHHPDPRRYVPLAKRHIELSALVDRWRTRQRGTDGGLPAELYFSGDRRVIDTRSGERVELRLDEAEARLLHELERPRALGDMASFETLEALRERGLIFEEDARFLSLVLPREPEARRLERRTPWSPAVAQVSKM